MRRVARYARRSNNQSLLEQGGAVHALRIVLDDIRFMNFALALDRGPLLVALPAQVGNAGRRYRRPGVFESENLMAAMAVLAARGQRITPGNCLAMQRAGMQSLLVGVASAASNLGELLTVRQFLVLEVAVAVDTGKRSVNRPG